MEHSALHSPEADKRKLTQFSKDFHREDFRENHKRQNEISLNAELNFSAFDNFIHDEQRRNRHAYLIGRTGAGKSTLLERVVVSDINEGKPGLFIDPHGESAERVLDTIKRTRKVCYADFSDTKYSLRYNPLAGIALDEAGKAADDMITATKQMFFERDFNAPTFTYSFRNHIIPLIESGTGTLMDALRMMSDRDFREGITTDVRDPIARLYWENEYPHAVKKKTYSDDTKSTKNKLAQILSTRNVRNVLDCRDPKLNLKTAFAQGYYVVVNLAKGKIGPESSSFIGSLLVAEANNALMELDTYTPTAVTLDEFQNYAPHVLSAMLAEIRKKGGQLTLAHQFASQLEDEIFDSIMGNCGTIISFQISPRDASLLAPQFDTRPQESFNPKALSNLEPFHAYMRTTDWELIETDPPPPTTGRKPVVVAQSRERFSRRL